MSKMTATQKIPSTKEKLSTIISGFENFDSEMKIGTRQRREKDEFRIAELKTEMKRLDSELVGEIKRRTEMNKSTQMWFEEKLTDLSESFTNTLNDRTTATNKRLDDLSLRISDLNSKLDHEKAEVLKYIDEQGERLANMLNEFKMDFEKDRALRIQREGEMVRQLMDHEHEANERFEHQIQSREARYNDVKTLLEENIKLRDKTEERFQNFFERETSRLYNELQTEAEVREREDDEIIEALNRYTLKLQNSLKIVNSTEIMAGKITPEQQQTYLNRIRAEMQQQVVQDIITKSTESCFKICTGKRGTGLDNGERECLSNCVERYMETMGVVNETLTARQKQ